jgi:hypothetical protein
MPSPRPRAPLLLATRRRRRRPCSPPSPSAAAFPSHGRASTASSWTPASEPSRASASVLPAPSTVRPQPRSRAGLVPTLSTATSSTTSVLRHPLLVSVATSLAPRRPIVLPFTASSASPRIPSTARARQHELPRRQRCFPPWPVAPRSRPLCPACPCRLP